jgi:hypothetical protein
VEVEAETELSELLVSAEEPVEFEETVEAELLATDEGRL